MLKQVINLAEIVPKLWLADGGYKNKFDVVEVDILGCTVYMPLQKNKSGEPIPPKEKDPKACHELYERMNTEEGKEIYKDRATYAELINAHGRNHGLKKLLVRGMEKVKPIAFLSALFQNFTRMSAFDLI